MIFLDFFQQKRFPISDILQLSKSHTIKHMPSPTSYSNSTCCAIFKTHLSILTIFLALFLLYEYFDYQIVETEILRENYISNTQNNQSCTIWCGSDYPYVSNSTNQTKLCYTEDQTSYRSKNQCKTNRVKEFDQAIKSKINSKLQIALELSFYGFCYILSIICQGCYSFKQCEEQQHSQNINQRYTYTYDYQMQNRNQLHRRKIQNRKKELRNSIELEQRLIHDQMYELQENNTQELIFKNYKSCAYCLSLIIRQSTLSLNCQHLIHQRCQSKWRENQKRCRFCP